ncbi:hypothetical protein CEXT_579391 [Caerostris extrusa]|uniref:Transmembrane protein n=1 Tax=Caerostris extrusa TaxID=172846 RepID=A0AAV4XIL4_CAEEX|nr:hypothetical protein CEXT_579391 [Caerostris extrusa]
MVEPRRGWNTDLGVVAVMGLIILLFRNARKTESSSSSIFCSVFGLKKDRKWKNESSSPSILERLRVKEGLEIERMVNGNVCIGVYMVIKLMGL